MDKTQTINVAYDRVKFIVIVFCMSSIISLDHEIVQFPDIVRMLWVYQTSQRNWVTIKVHYGYLRKCLLGWNESRLGFVTPCNGKVSLGPLGNAHHYKPYTHCN